MQKTQIGKQDIKSMNLAEIREVMVSMGQPSVRAAQVYRWLHRGVISCEQMSDLSKDFRSQLAERFYIPYAQILRKQVSALDGTVKYLFRLIDGECVESVLMKYHHGYSVCISSQVGCKMGCTFCATGKSGFSRNLRASEILSQVQAAQADCGTRISNIVLMGMGEPLDNYENVLRFLELVSSPEGMNIGMRHISLSTCGIVDKIYDLADRKLQLTLSISLHAPNDRIRVRTMPINRRWGVEKLLEACRYYGKTTGRRISFEYALIQGVNDSEQCARELASRLQGMLCHVNLIPVNQVDERSYRASGKAFIYNFQKTLTDFGINATVRRTLGADINAACGQLRRSQCKKNEVSL